MVALVSATPGRVMYRDLVSGEVWLELGDCNRCGLCIVGTERARDPALTEWTSEPGQPGACRDLDYETRPHFVTRPDIKRRIPTCSLSFEVLR